VVPFFYYYYFFTILWMQLMNANSSRKPETFADPDIFNPDRFNPGSKKYVLIFIVNTMHTKL